ncbi:AbrB/MazE/SpoVT family DNA-binding domain-containing protein [Actinomyces sp. W5033]|uniref:AbrB/MazE/SpoVT family DNA-binding domain-containing protein n=1 Tax=Actinomyces sp. W5033 TaxID=3446479 RepID=UPI003EE0F47E
MTVGSRGQVALPAQARRNVGLEPGDQLIVLSDPAEGLALIPLARLLERAPADDPLAMLVRGAIRPTAPSAASGTASTAAGETGPEPTPPPTPTSGKE